MANPGCYPTSAQLPLIPLLEAGGIAGDDIIIDAKSGVTGAGRDAKQQNLFSEVTEGVHAYGIAGHRHAPEIEQGLSEAAGRPVIVNFTPHLMPMSRGILSSIYVRLADGASAGDLQGDPGAEICRGALRARPCQRAVAGDAPCPGLEPLPHRRLSPIGCRAGRSWSRSIDNLVKGASGQAVQNMNLMTGWAETTGLEQQPMFP